MGREGGRRKEEGDEGGRRAGLYTAGMGESKGRRAKQRRLGDEARQRLDNGYTRLNLQLSRAQGQAFRFLWLFVPEPSVARKLRFQHMLASRLLSEAGQQAVMYGALVAVARGGGSALELALVGVAGLVP